MSTVSVSRNLFSVDCDVIHVSVFGGFQSSVVRDVEVATVLGGQVVLDCDFSASNPPPQVTWFADDTAVQEMSGPNAVVFLSGGRFLFLQQLTMQQRMMRYHCSVRNSFYLNPMPMRAPTTYTLTGDLPRDDSVTVYMELGSMVGAVGKRLEFIYAAAARRADTGANLPLGITCTPSANPLVMLPDSTILPIVFATLKDAARDEAQVNFTCQLSSLLTGLIQNISGTIIVSS